MELTIDEALKKAIEAHSAGQTREADKLYTAILSAQPKHPDANHNMGVLAVDVGKKEQALPFFKAALEANSKIEQFWFSYIDALLKLGRAEEAQNILNQAKQNRVIGDAFDRLEASIKKSSLDDSKPLPGKTEAKNQKANVSSDLTLDQALKLAKKKAKKGYKEEAKSIYQEILNKLPRNKKAISGLKKLSVHHSAKFFNTQEPPQHHVQPLINLYKQGRFIEVLKAIDQGQKQFSGSAKVLNIQGVANARIGRLDAAISSYRQALKLKPNYAEPYNNMGSALNDKGDLDAAIDSFQQALKLEPGYAEAYNNMGNALRGKGDLGAAMDSFQQALKLEPGYAEAYNNMGNALQDKGDLGAAIDNYQQALKCKPGFADAYNNLGTALRGKGDLGAAMDSFQQALKLKPGYAEVYNNIGNALQDKGDLGAAIDSFQQALKCKPDYADAYNNMGNALNLKGDLQAAINNYQQALKCKPGFADAYNNLGVALEDKGDLDAAIDHYQQALKLKPDYDQAYANIGNILKGIRFRKPVPGLEDTILELLQNKTIVGPNDIAAATISLLKFNPSVKNILAKISALEQESVLVDTLERLSKVALFIEIMRVSLIPDLEIENLLTNIRSNILFNYSSLVGNNDTLVFSSALALQCFTNEYIYNQSDKETEALGKLEKSVEATLKSGQQPGSIEIACLACYKALKDYSWCHLLSIPDSLSELEIRQIREPEEENRLRDEIPVLQEIKDSISSDVRKQYEENPYPRWVNLGLPLKSKSIYKLTKGLNIQVSDADVLMVDTPQMLIAGCGTGQHSINSAKRFANTEVLAVDLSLSSLAYAKRKTLELGIKNIEYLQADILDLQTLDRKFDLIESSGVLHHMEDPMAGWKVLTNCLKPGGLFRIGLYSELSRQHIVRIRKSNNLHQLDSSSDGIRLFRSEVIKSDQIDHKRIVTSADFFSLSTLRDLIFHVQEHRFTIPQLRNCLDELGLVFCGFEFGNKTIEREFQLDFGDKDDLYNLEKWNVYEKGNPHSFAEMYQFWCQKIN